MEFYSFRCWTVLNGKRFTSDSPENNSKLQTALISLSAVNVATAFASKFNQNALISSVINGYLLTNIQSQNSSEFQIQLHICWCLKLEPLPFCCAKLITKNKNNRVCVCVSLCVLNEMSCSIKLCRVISSRSGRESSVLGSRIRNCR